MTDIRRPEQTGCKHGVRHPGDETVFRVCEECRDAATEKAYWCETCHQAFADKRCPQCGLKLKRVG